MNSLAQYNAVKHLIRPGDVVLFWGTSLLSATIEAFDAGPSHSAIVRQGVSDQGQDATITQSTIQRWNGVELNGVQTEPLGATVAGYDSRAAIAVLRLRQDIRARIDWHSFYEIIGASDGFVGYDIAGFFEYLIRDIPVIGAHVAQGEHKTKMVCSAWVVALLTGCGVLLGIDWTQTTPTDLLRMAIYEDALPLLGR